MTMRTARRSVRTRAAALATAVTLTTAPAAHAATAVVDDGADATASRTDILTGQEFRQATAFNGLFEEAFRMMRDCWAVPEFDEMMKVCQREFCAVFQDGADPVSAAEQVQIEHEAILKKRGRTR